MSQSPKSLMRSEIDETPEAVRRLLAQSGEAMRAAGLALRDLDPPVVATVARGSCRARASERSVA